MSDDKDRKQEVASTEKERPTNGKPPSYGTRLVQNKKDIKAIIVPQEKTKK